MEWLTKNPIADMSGPDFLFVYGVLTALTIDFIRMKARRHDPTFETSFAPAPIPGKLSPIELAYLSGCPSKTLGTIVFDLWNRGYLEATVPKKGKTRLTKVSPTPEYEHLTPMEQGILLSFRDSDDTGGGRIFQKQRATIQRLGLDLKPALQEELLLMPEEAQRQARQLFWQAVPWLLMVGGYKLVIALEKGKTNVLFLISFMFIGLLGLIFASTLPRLTRRGADYLKRMKVAFRDAPGTANFAIGDGMPADPKAVIGVALFGLGGTRGNADRRGVEVDRPQIRRRRLRGGFNGGHRELRRK